MNNKHSMHTLLLLIILFIGFGCHNNTQKHSDSLTLKTLNLGFKIALEETMLTDWEKTKDSLGRFLVYPLADLNHELSSKEFNKYNFRILDSLEICSLNNGDHYLILKKPNIASDTVIFRIYSDCVYKTPDTCITGMFCGGGLALIMKNKDNSLAILDTIGFSN